MVSSIKKIAIDCMGGDDAPEMVLEGLSKVINYDNSFSFNLFGRTEEITKLIEKYNIDKNRVEIFDSKGFIVSADTKPLLAMRNAMQSSMGKAIDSVKIGDSLGCISAGNTGAYMGMAKLILKMVQGIDRPAIASLIPTKKSPIVMLDLGANSECNAENLVQFAVMGEALFKAFSNVDTAKVGLLNIGSEDNKGNSIVKEAFKILKTENNVSNFIGFIEGDKIFNGNCDVVVSDGFSGNITLKVIEGCAKFILSEVKNSFRANTLAKILGLFSKGILKHHLIGKIDPRNHNGAVLLGVNGVVVKSHGGTDSVGFANSIKFTINIINNNLVQNTADIITKQNMEMNVSIND